MELELARNWWVVALQGVLAILFGVLVFFWPAVPWLMVVYTFAAYALIDGGIAIVAAARGQSRRRWALLLEGLVGILAGVLTVAWPEIPILVLYFLIAGWSIASGLLQIAAAIELRRYLPGEWALVLSGVLSVVLGLVLALMPEAGLVVLAWWVGAYLIVFGALVLALAFRLRSLARHPVSPEHALVA